MGVEAGAGNGGSGGGGATHLASQESSIAAHVPPTFPPLPHPTTAEPQNTGREKGFGTTRVWFRLPQRGIDWTKETASGEEEEEIDNEERGF